MFRSAKDKSPLLRAGTGLLLPLPFVVRERNGRYVGRSSEHVGNWRLGCMCLASSHKMFRWGANFVTRLGMTLWFFGVLMLASRSGANFAIVAEDMAHVCLPCLLLCFLLFAEGS